MIILTRMQTRHQLADFTRIMQGESVGGVIMQYRCVFVLLKSMNYDIKCDKVIRFWTILQSKTQSCGNRRAIRGYINCSSHPIPVWPKHYTITLNRNTSVPCVLGKHLAVYHCRRLYTSCLIIKHARKTMKTSQIVIL